MRPSSTCEPDACTRPVVVIGVAGGSGSGKTTVSEVIESRVGADCVLRLSQDRYYRDLAHLGEHQRKAHNYDHPAAIEEELLIEHLRELIAGETVDLPIYDFTRHVRTLETEVIRPRPAIIVEGILVLALAGLRELLDVKIFVDTDPDIRLIRRLRRDMAERGRTVEEVVEQYTATVRPMHLEFVEPSKRWADVVIPEGGFNRVAVDLVISHIECLLATVDSRGGSM